jgi:lipopolysaccharide transport system permease protein
VLDSDAAAQTSITAKQTPTHHTKHSLPDEPLVVIQPSKTWVGVNLGDVWTYRELLYFLMWRDVKVRYKQTALGAAWAIIQPLFTMLIFSFIFGRVAGISSEGLPYPLFAYAGLLPWIFFSNAVTASGNSLIGSANLITKVYFPRLIIPAAAVGAGLVDFCISAVVLALMMLYYRVPPSWNLLLLPVLVVLTTLLALGVGMWMSALNVKYRDVRFALPFLIQLWMFASPIIYPVSILPEKLRWVLVVNPLTGIIEGYRAALYGGRFDVKGLVTSAAITLLLLVYSAFTFRRMEKRFADII